MFSLGHIAGTFQIKFDGNNELNQAVYKTAANAGILALIPHGVSSALDVGCGTGKLGVELQKMSIISDGITLSEMEKEIASCNYRDVWLFNLENGLPSSTRKYDLIILSHVLEHIANPSKLMASLSSFLNSPGYILCAIPNMLFLYNRLKLLFGKVEYEQYGLMDYTHVRWYTQKTITELFKQYGFCVDRATVNGNLPLGPLRKIITRKMADFMDTSIVSMFPGLLAWEFHYRFKRSGEL